MMKALLLVAGILSTLFLVGFLFASAVVPAAVRPKPALGCPVAPRCVCDNWKRIARRLTQDFAQTRAELKEDCLYTGSMKACVLYEVTRDAE